jgi:hypothetical protein
MITI